MAFWGQDQNYAGKLNLLMVCIEVGRVGLDTAQRFGQQYCLPAAVTNGFIELSGEMPSFGQLGCKGFVVLGPHGEFAMQRTVPCYLEAGQASFKAVENLLASLWNMARPVLAPPGPPGGARGGDRATVASVGVPEMDQEHEALEKALGSLQASPKAECLSALLELWQRHSQHEEELFERFDFGRHKSAAKGQAATAPHCEHHRHIARMMETALQASTASCCQTVPADVVASLVGEIGRHIEVYDAAYAGKFAMEPSCTAQ